MPAVDVHVPGELDDVMGTYAPPSPSFLLFFNFLTKPGLVSFFHKEMN